MTVDLKPKLVCDIAPKENNIRNSEGSFLKAPNGDILFAYSCFTGSDASDHSPSNIKMIRSSDNGETWSDDHVMIAPAKHFGVSNVMSTSPVYHKNGDLSFYFFIKELLYICTYLFDKKWENVLFLGREVVENREITEEFTDAPERKCIKE